MGVCHVAAFGSMAPVQAAIAPEDLPRFDLRLRVTRIGGDAPQGQTFRYSFGVKENSGAATGNAWGEWIGFGDADARHVTGPHYYPNTYLQQLPAVIRLDIAGVVDPTVVEGEARFDTEGAVHTFEAELFSGTLGLLVWNAEDESPRIETMTQYNRRIWTAMADGVQGDAPRPRFFPIIDRFITGDGDRVGLAEGFRELSRAGYSAMMVNPSKHYREAWLAAGATRTAGAVYNPPGYAFDHDPAVDALVIDAWAAEQADPFVKAGFARNEMAAFAMSDEPGWYFPAAFKPLNDNPKALERFRSYLARQGLAPADVGVASWEDVRPLGRSKATDLPSRRLFYWTMRFFSWDSSRHFAECTRALERAFYPGMPIFTNWNFFAGRSYVPGPVANNTAKTDPDAAMGGHDWFEFGRMRGGTMLWTEDWFGDNLAYQWSYYCSRLRSAARKGGIEFGGYIIPRTAGQRPGGLLQKNLAIVAHGGKTIKNFVFGPEYNFPGNCYSHNTKVLPLLPEAYRMIARAEDFLWPGRPCPAQVAMLFPRSAQLWDARDEALPDGVPDDATHVNLNARTVDYLCEVYNLYLALMHANIPCDFVEEDDLDTAGLAPYKLLYVTAPNVPTENQRSLLKWVQEGGHVVTTCGALTRDRYDDDEYTFRESVGLLPSEPGDGARRLIPDLSAVGAVGSLVLDARSRVSVIGRREKPLLPDSPHDVVFDDGAVAQRVRTDGAGRVTHWTFFPGLSYARTATHAGPERLPEGWSAPLRDFVTAPVRAAGVSPPVTVSPAMVEAPLLESDHGIAITVFNWTNAPLDSVTVSVRTGRPLRSASSVVQGPLEIAEAAGVVTVRLPLDSVDVVTLAP